VYIIYLSAIFIRIEKIKKTYNWWRVTCENHATMARDAAKIRNMKDTLIKYRMWADLKDILKVITHYRATFFLIIYFLSLRETMHIVFTHTHTHTT
jgi:hypothetical protein